MSVNSGQCFLSVLFLISPLANQTIDRSASPNQLPPGIEETTEERQNSVSIVKGIFTFTPDYRIEVESALAVFEDGLRSSESDRQAKTEAELRQKNQELADENRDLQKRLDWYRYTCATRVSRIERGGTRVSPVFDITVNEASPVLAQVLDGNKVVAEATSLLQDNQHQISFSKLPLENRLAVRFFALDRGQKPQAEPLVLDSSARGREILEAFPASSITPTQLTLARKSSDAGAILFEVGTDRDAVASFSCEKKTPEGTITTVAFQGLRLSADKKILLNCPGAAADEIALKTRSSVDRELGTNTTNFDKMTNFFKIPPEPWLSSLPMSNKDGNLELGFTCEIRQVEIETTTIKYGNMAKFPSYEIKDSTTLTIKADLLGTLAKDLDLDKPLRMKVALDLCGRKHSLEFDATTRKEGGWGRGKKAQYFFDRILPVAATASALAGEPVLAVGLTALQGLDPTDPPKEQALPTAPN